MKNPKIHSKSPNLLDDLRIAAKRYRASRDLTQKEFAKLVGVEQPVLSRFESGRSSPKGDVLNRIAALVRTPELAVADRLQAAVDELRLPGVDGKQKLHFLEIELDHIVARLRAARIGLNKQVDGIE